jgi:hypothetical protein
MRCSMLHLLRRREIVVADGSRRLVPDAMAPAKRGQRGIRDGEVLRGEFFVDTHQIAAAAIHQFKDLVAVRLGLLGAFNPRHRRGARVEHRPDGPAGDLQRAGNLPDPVALRP